MNKLDIFEGAEGAELVQSTFLFKELSFDETTQLASHFRKKSYAKGSSIIEENAIGEALYLIQSGSVIVTKADGKKQETITELGEGEIVGEMSLIEAALTSASVVAKTQVECLVLMRTDLDKLMKANPVFTAKVYKAFCHVLSERLRKTSHELFELRTKK